MDNKAIMDNQTNKYNQKMQNLIDLLQEKTNKVKLLSEKIHKNNQKIYNTCIPFRK